MPLFDQILHPSSRYCLLTKSGWLTYKDVYNKSIALGNWLNLQGIKPGDIVGIDIKTENSAYLTIVMFGCWYNGITVAFISDNSSVFYHKIKMIASKRTQDFFPGKQFIPLNISDSDKLTEPDKIDCQSVAVLILGRNGWAQITHKNILSTISAMRTSGIQLYRTDVILAEKYLNKINHIVTQCLILKEGGRIGYCLGLEEQEAMINIRPTFLNKNQYYYNLIWNKSIELYSSYFEQIIYDIAYRVLSWCYFNPGIISTLLKVFFDTSVINKIRLYYGLQRVRLGIFRIENKLCSSLLKNTRILLGKAILVPSWGITETTGIISLSPTNQAYQLDNVGIICPGIKIKMEDENILVGGTTLMKGYYQSKSYQIIKTKDCYYFDTERNGQLIYNSSLILK